jgi:MOSC domain-containing protein YiiM
MNPTLVQLNVSPGGMPKVAVASARVGRDGVAGDWQINRKYHGGPDRAVCLFSSELYAELAAEGIHLQPGDVGENFTTRGIDLRELKVGSRLRVGDCLIEITKVRIPCTKLNGVHPELLERIAGRSGWMCRVIEEGVVRTGDAITVL